MSRRFSHALFAVDFSPATDPTLACLPELMSLGVEEVTLVHVLEVHYPAVPDTEHIPHYEERLREVAGRLEGNGLAVHVEVRVGDPAQELLAAARERGASLVVAGAQGQGVFGQALLGSVAAALIQQSTLPLLILHLETFTDQGEDQCRVVRPDLGTHILHPTDFSDVAERAYAYVAQLADCCTGRVTLLHVQDVHTAAKEQRANIEEYDRLDAARLERLKADLTRETPIEVNWRVEYGAPGEVILQVAQEVEPTLIVLGTQGRGYLSEVMLGSASRHVVRHAAAPVLLIPAPR